MHNSYYHPLLGYVNLDSTYKELKSDNRPERIRPYVHLDSTYKELKSIAEWDKDKGKGIFGFYL
mgnify:CR=1 FL=1